MSVLSLDDVVALNALIVTAVGLSFALSGRKERGKTFLDLRKSTLGAPPSPTKKTAGRPYGADALARLEAMENEQAHASSRRLSVVDVETGDLAEAPITRELNVFFNWNGHTWEAFEVLGVPAGSSRDVVIAAFHSSRAKSPDSTPFFQAATDAILKHK